MKSFWFKQLMILVLCVGTLFVQLQAAPPATSIQVVPDKVSLKTNNTIDLKAQLYPLDAAATTLQWTSSDPSVATVDLTTGKVTANGTKSGTTTITVEDGVKLLATCVVTVDNATKTSSGLLLLPNNMGLVKGQKINMMWRLLPATATYEGLTWRSSNEQVAKVDINTGLVTAMSQGQALITVKDKNNSNSEATCRINVTPTSIYAIGVALNRDVLYLKQGDSHNLVVSMLPTNASMQGFKWTSSKSEIVKVSQSGEIEVQPEALKVGSEAVITATSVNGNRQASCKVYVQSANVAALGVEAFPYTINLQKGTDYTLFTQSYPLNATNLGYTVTSNLDTAIARLHAPSGLLTAYKEGETTIKLTTTNANRAAEVKVVVTSNKVEATDIYLLPQGAHSLQQGDMLQLIPYLYPSNATLQGYLWESSNPAVASVTPLGRVIAASAGTTVIKITSLNGNRSTTCKITVTTTSQATDRVLLQPEYAYLDMRSSLQFITSLVTADKSERPLQATAKGYKWTVNNSYNGTNGRASISASGHLIPEQVGQVQVVVTELNSNKSAKAVVVITHNDVKAQEMYLVPGNARMEVGRTLNLTANVLPDTSTYRGYVWYSSNPAVASVHLASGEITANAAGTALISATSVNGGNTAVCTLKVEEALAIPVQAIGIIPEHPQIRVGQHLQLQAVLSPMNATHKGFRWELSTPAGKGDDIVLDSTQLWINSQTGEIKALKPGNVVIKVTSLNGNVVATSTVSIAAASTPVPATTMGVAPLTVTLLPGDALVLTPYMRPFNATDLGYRFSSDKPYVAEVDPITGEITANNPGKVVITTTSNNGKYSATTDVEVVPYLVPAVGVGITPDGIMGIKQGERLNLLARMGPANATAQGYIWTTSNATVVTVNQVTGEIEGIAASGSAYIDVQSINGGHTARLTVYANPATGATKENVAMALTIIPNDPYLQVGTHVDMVAKLYSQQGTANPASIKDNTWMSDNPEIASVHPLTGKLIVHKEGQVKIVATNANNQVKDSILLTATNGVIEARGAEVLARNTVYPNNFYVGYNYADNYGKSILLAQMQPFNATNQGWVWTSSNPGVVQVHPLTGEIVGVNKSTGTVDVLATAVNGSYTVAIKVTNQGASGGSTSYPAYMSVNTLSLKVGNVRQLFNYFNTYSTYYQETPQGYQWTSSNPSVARVNSSTGLVTALQPGVTTITSKSLSTNRTVTCAVTVVSNMIPAKHFGIIPAKAGLLVGQILPLTPRLLPCEATEAGFVWESSDPTTVSVNVNGELLALKPGKVTITARSINGDLEATGEYIVSSSQEATTSVFVLPQAAHMRTGDTIRMTPVQQPSYATYQAVSWSSSSPAVVTVDAKGQVVAHSQGSASIKATWAGGKEVSVPISVHPQAQYATQLPSIIPSVLYLPKKGSAFLCAAQPSTQVRYQEFAWVSRNAAVARVHPITGEVTAQEQPGDVEVDMSVVDAPQVQTCQIHVQDNVVQEISGVQIGSGATQIEMLQGQYLSLEAAFKTLKASQLGWQWTSSQPTIVEVSALGTLYAKATGNAVITLTSVGHTGTYTATLNVEVTSNVVLAERVVLTPEIVYLQSGTKQLIPTLYPVGATNTGFTWKVLKEEAGSTPGGLTVDAEGKLSAQTGTGIYTIQVTSKNGGCTATCVVYMGRDGDASPTGVSLIPSTAGLVPGDTLNLLARLRPYNAYDVALTWQSSNNTIATVNSNGQVVARGVGQVVITASRSGQTAYCYIEVTPQRVLATGLQVIPENAYLIVGQRLNLLASHLPTKASNLGFEWVSDDPTVATVSPLGEVLAVKVGVTTIKVKSVNGKHEAVAVVQVQAAKVATNIEIIPGDLGIEVGTTAWLQAQLFPVDATNTGFRWESNAPGVAMVDPQTGVLNALSAGEATIKVSTNIGAPGDIVAQCKVKVSAKGTIIPAELVYLLPDKPQYLRVGKLNDPGTYTVLSAQLIPANATVQGFVWESSNPEVASVSAGGRVMAHSAGTTLITVTSLNGNKQTTCPVTVTASVVNATQVRLVPENVYLTKDYSMQLVPNLIRKVGADVYEDPTNLGYEWSTSDSYVATVSPSGVVKGVGEGVATITVTALTLDAKGLVLRTIKSTAQVTVKAAVTQAVGIYVIPENANMAVSDRLTLTVTMLPSGANNHEGYVWRSSNPSVAQVHAKSGEIMALGQGKAIITVTSLNGGYSASTTINVQGGRVAATSVGIIPERIYLRKDSSMNLIAQLTPIDASNQGFEWSYATPTDTENNKKVWLNTVTGEIVAKDQTVANKPVGIKVTSFNKTVTGAEVSAIAYVYVTSSTRRAERVVIAPGYTNLLPGEYMYMIATHIPSDATHLGFEWTSSDTTVARIHPITGEVTARKPGQTKIKVRSKNEGVTDSAYVNVIESVVPAKSLGVAPSSVTIAVGQSYNLNARTIPINATLEGVIWTSNSAAVKVNPTTGEIYGVSANNNVTITVTDKVSKLSATCKVTVYAGTVDADFVHIMPDMANLLIGDQIDLYAILYPGTADTRGFVWTSDNPSIATVNALGQVEAKSLGRTSIRVRSLNGDKTSTCDIVVGDVFVPATKVEIVPQYSTTGNKRLYIPTEAGNPSVGASKVWFTPRMTPHNATYRGFVWSVANNGYGSSVIDAKSGELHMLSGYDASADYWPNDQDITVVSNNSQSGTLSATAYLYEYAVKQTGSTLSVVPNEVTSLPVATTMQLKAFMATYTNAYSGYHWESSDTTKVRVSASGGLVTAMATTYDSKGINTPVRITAYLLNDPNKKAYCNITVPVPYVQATGLGIVPEKVRLAMYQAALPLAVRFYPANASDQDRLTWSSSDESVVKVAINPSTNVASLNAQGVGQATVRVVSQNGQLEAVCQVTVDEQAEAIALTGMYFDADTMYLQIGQKQQLVPNSIPANATDYGYMFASSSNFTVGVDAASGMLDAKQAGTVIITVRGGQTKAITATCVVKVVDKITPATGLHIIPESATLTLGSSIGLTGRMEPSTANYQGYEWISNNPAVATVERATGKVLGQQAGVSVVTLRSINGDLMATSTITVVDTIVDATAVRIMPDSLSLKPGGKYTLVPVLYPDSATNMGFEWKVLSGGAAVASVNSRTGEVRALGVGVAIIEVTSKNKNLTAQCTVRVRTDYVDAIGVRMIPDEASVLVDDYINFVAQLLPDSATNQGYVWTSSNPVVGSINSVTGRFAALSPGTTWVTVRANNGSWTSTGLVTVKYKVEPALGVYIVPELQNVPIGNSTQFTAVQYPAGATQLGARWSSSDATIATIDSLSGVAKAIKIGTAIINVRTSNGDKTATAVMRVTAKPVDATGVTLSPEKVKLYIGESIDLQATLQPDSASHLGYTWYSNNEAVAKVNSNGRVTAVASGTADIRVTSLNKGWTAICEVVVESNITELVDMEVLPSSITLAVNQTFDLRVRFEPSDATNLGLRWSSDNSSIASVSNTGKVTAKSTTAGAVAHISATSINGGITKVCTVTVTQAEVGATSIVITPLVVEMQEGEERVLGTQLTPADATTKALTWSMVSSSVPNVLSIDPVTGLIKALNVGTARIKVVSANNNVTAVRDVTVTANNIKATSLLLDFTEVYLPKDSSFVLSPFQIPSNAARLGYEWTVESDRVATITTSGALKSTAKITGRGVGTTVITVTSKNQGLVARCTIHVTETYRKADKVELIPDTIYIKTGEKRSLYPRLNPSTASNYEGFTWVVLNPDTATVNQLGEVTAIAKGHTKVIVTALNGGLKDTTVVYVVDNDVPVTGVRVTPKTLEMMVKVGLDQYLSARLLPTGAMASGVQWYSANPTIVEVTALGQVIPKKRGTVRIYATAVGTTYSDYCEVVVTEIIPAVSFTIKPDNATLAYTQNVQLHTYVFPDTATNLGFVWATSDPTVATVSEHGVVTTLSKEGAAIITAICNNAVIDRGVVLKATAAIQVKVAPSNPTGVRLIPQRVVLANGDSAFVTANMLPADAKYTGFDWTVKDPMIVTVDTVGKIKAKNVGTTWVYAKVKGLNQIKDSCLVEVTAAEVPAQYITVFPDRLSMIKGDRTTLSVNMLPANASNKGMIYTTSDENIVAVNDFGEVVAIGIGNATITVLSRNGGHADSCLVVVTAARVPATGVLLIPSKLKILQGTTGKLIPHMQPSNATFEGFTWNISNRSGAADLTVSNDGLVFAGAQAGTADVTVTSVNGHYTATSQVEVVSNSGPATALRVSPRQLGLPIDTTMVLHAGLFPNDIPDLSYTWTSSDPAVVWVDARTGEITTKALGRAVITAMAGGLSGTAEVIVTKKFVKATSLTIIPADTVYMNQQAHATFVARLMPDSATYIPVVWKSSATNQLLVDEYGEVTTLSQQGTVGVSARTLHSTINLYDTTMVVIAANNAVVPTTAVRVFPVRANITVGDVLLMQGQQIPANASFQGFHWTVDNTALARIDSVSGELKALGAGVVVVTATSKNGAKQAGAIVNISATKVVVAGLQLIPDQLSMVKGTSAQLLLNLVSNNASYTMDSVQWTSKNVNLVQVNSYGLLTAQNATGNAMVYVQWKTKPALRDSVWVTITNARQQADSVIIIPDRVNLVVGQYTELVARMQPTTATFEGFRWSLSAVNNGLVSVDSLTGQLYAKTASTTLSDTVWVCDVNSGKRARCVVTVGSSTTAPTQIRVIPDVYSLVVGQQAVLRTRLEPLNATTKPLVWRSEDESILTVNQLGEIVARKVGVTIVTVKVESATVGTYYTATCRVHVTKNAVNATGVEVLPSTATIANASTLRLSARFVPDSATTAAGFAWACSALSTQMVVDEDGLITAKTVGGPYTITATSIINPILKGESKVTVGTETLPTALTLVPNTQNMVVGDYLDLKPRLGTTNLAYQRYIWTSNNDGVVAVSPYGEVTALKPGVAVIMVKNYTNATNATCTITVTQQSVVLKKLSIYPDRLNLALNTLKTWTLVGNMTPANATHLGFEWASKNTAVATVHPQRGEVTAVAAGNTIIYLRALGTGMIDSIPVTVTATVVPTVSLDLVPNNIVMVKGDTTDIVPRLLPSNATNTTAITLTSANAAQVKVENGKLIALAATAVVTPVQISATASGKTAYAWVRVVDAKVDATGMMVYPDRLSLVQGTEFQLKAQLLPSGATYQGYRWTSSNASVVKVDSITGELRTLAVGQAVITARSLNGNVSAASYVTVTKTEVPATAMAIIPDTLNLTVPEMYPLAVRLNPDSATYKPISWGSNNASYVTVDATSGLVKAVSAHASTYFTITASMAGVSNATSRVFVRSAAVPATKLSLDSTSRTIEVGEVTRLTPRLDPRTLNAAATDSGYVWTSADTSVVVVTATGHIIGRTQGTAVVTVKSINKGLTATCNVTVTAATPILKALAINPAVAYMRQGDELNLEIVKTPENAVLRDAKWVSSVPSYVSVDANGKIKVLVQTVADVTITLTATGTHGYQTATSIIKITGKDSIQVKQLSIQPSVVSLVHKDSLQLTVQQIPVNATYLPLTWASDKPGVATVDRYGMLRTVAPGRTTITATNTKGMVASCDVYVVLNAVPLQKLAIIPEVATMPLNSTLDLTLKAFPDSATYNGVVWSVSPGYATIDAKTGRVTTSGSYNGSTFTVMAKVGAIEAKSTIKIYSAEPIAKQIQILPSNPMYMQKGDVVDMVALLQPTTALNTGFDWRSSNPSVARISSLGRLEAIGAGTDTLTVTTLDGKLTATCIVTVTDSEVTADSIRINPRVLRMAVNTAVNFTTLLYPANATYKNLTWTVVPATAGTISPLGRFTAGASATTAKVVVQSANGGVKDSCAITIATVVNPTGIAVQPTNLVLAVGSVVPVMANLQPATATYQELVWSVADTSVAAVDPYGYVRAKKVGYTQLTVTTATNTPSVTIPVTVVAAPVQATGITLSHTSATVLRTDVLDLIATLVPANAVYEEFEWTTNNAAVATVSASGRVTPSATAADLSKAVITVKSRTTGHTATCEVTVTTQVAPGVTKVLLTDYEIYLPKGSTATLGARLLPANANGRYVVSWTSGTPAKVSVGVNNGVINALEVGTAIITANANGTTATCLVHVTQNHVPATGLALLPDAAGMLVGDLLQLTVRYQPDSASSKGVTWHVLQKDEFVTVTGTGLVTARKAGQATVVATSANGNHVAYSTIYVTKSIVGTMSVTLRPSALYLKKGDMGALVPQVLPDSATYQGFTWSQSTANIVTLPTNDYGRLTALNKGNTNVTVTVNNFPLIKATSYVEVTEVKDTVSLVGITVTPKQLRMLVGTTNFVNVVPNPLTATSVSLSWESSDTSKVKVNPITGKVMAIKAGTSVVRVRAAQGRFIDSCVITVDDTWKNATNIVAYPASLSLAVGKSWVVNTTLVPADATTMPLTWNTDKPGVATVDASGRITAVAIGTATITVTSSNNGVSTTISVVVSAATAVTSVEIAPTQLTIEKGQIGKLTATQYPATAGFEGFNWSSLDASIATVDAFGNVTGHTVGSTVVTVTTVNGGKKTSVIVNVVAAAVPSTGVYILPVNPHILQGTGSVLLTAHLTPDNTTSEDKFTWTIVEDINSVIILDPATGMVTANAGVTGKARIRVATSEGLQAFTWVYVDASSVAPTRIDLNTTVLSLQKLHNYQLVADVLPHNATYKPLSWTSSNEAVALVNSNGYITALTTGSVTITVSIPGTSPLISATCALTVTDSDKPTPPNAELHLSAYYLDMVVNDAYLLKADMYPKGAETDQGFRWEVTQGTAASVDGLGYVRAINPGLAIIKVTAINGGQSKECLVRVNNTFVPLDSISIWPTKLELNKDSTYMLVANRHPANATMVDLRWTSQNPAIATVDQWGIVTAVATGSTTVTVLDANGNKSSSIPVVVRASAIIRPITNIQLNVTDTLISVGQVIQLLATVSPEGYTGSGTLVWSFDSGSDKVWLTNQGQVLGAANGVATIRVTTSNGVTTTCIVRVGVPVSSIAIAGANPLGILVGNTATLTATILPANATDKTVTWSTSDGGVASINASGQVTANAAGTATITATASNGMQATLTVIVTAQNIPATGVALLTADTTMQVGATGTLRYQVTPANATNKTVTWTSSAPAVATINASTGLITAVTPGTTTIIVTTQDGGYIATRQLTVVPQPVLVTNIVMLTPDTTMYIGGVGTLRYQVAPANATNKAVTWTSSNPAIATVNGNTGVITALAQGSTIITATAQDGSTISAFRTVSVIRPVTSVTMLTQDTTMHVGGTAQLRYTIAPANATNKAVTWFSNAVGVVSVDAVGHITAVSAGTARVSFTTQDGTNLTGFVDITVVVPATNLVVLTPDTTMHAGGTATLRYTITPSTTTNKAVDWASDNIAVVTVDAIGNVSAVGAGTARVTATTKDGTNLSDDVVITVVVPVTSIAITPLDTTMQLGGTGTLRYTISPLNATNQTVTWSSSDATTVSVDAAGQVTAHVLGEAIITVTTVDGGLTATCTVRVVPQVIPITSIEIVDSNIDTTMLVGGTATLRYRITPDNATDKGVKWQTDNSPSVEVDATTGLLTARSVGTATITVITNEGSNTASRKVHVVPVVVTGVTLLTRDTVIYPGDLATLRYRITPANATDKTVTWKSGNPAVATIDATTGQITAHTVGQALITITTNDQHLEDSTYIVVEGIAPYDKPVFDGLIVNHKPLNVVPELTYYKHMLLCDESELDTVLVEFQLPANVADSIGLYDPTGAVVYVKHQFKMAVPKPGIYRQEMLLCMSADPTKTEKYTLELRRPYPTSYGVIVQKEDVVLIANNNKKYNGGYYFVGYEWYGTDSLDNTSLLSTQQNYYASVDGSKTLDPSLMYTVKLITDKADTLETCPYKAMVNQVNINAFPNPLPVNDWLKVQITGKPGSRGGVADGEPITVSIFTSDGKLTALPYVYHYGPAFAIQGFTAPGLYFVRLQSAVSGLDKILRINVY